MRERKNKIADKRKDNRRETGRISVNMLVDYKADGHFLFDFCKDLGQGGVFIETPDPKEPGSVIDLTFNLPDEPEFLKTQGKVIWAQAPIEGRKDLTPGMGIQFLGFTEEQRVRLQRFVDKQTLKKSA